jgi:AcrR family transcriptional regulator
MIDAAIHSLQRHGVAGMSFTEVLRDSGAARGAIYHHFPGGKEQLVTEAATRNGGDVRAHLAMLPADDPAAVVAAFLDAVRPVLAASAAGGGCAIAAITVGAAGTAGTDLQRVAGGIFTSWTETLAGRLASAGLAAGEATGLATALIMLLEGAHVLCRAAGTLEPFDEAARSATTLARASYAPP